MRIKLIIEHICAMDFSLFAALAREADRQNVSTRNSTRKKNMLREMEYTSKFVIEKKYKE